MSSSPIVPPVHKDPSKPAAGSRNRLIELPPEIRNRIYKLLLPKNTTVSINRRADLPTIIQDPRDATIRSEASGCFFGSNKILVSRTITHDRLPTIIDKIKHADTTSLQWARNWKLSYEVRLPPATEDVPEEELCICAQSIVGTVTFVASARRLTGEAMPFEELSPCQDRSACDYRALMRQVREAYRGLGITMQRLFPGTVVNPLSIIDPDLDSDSESESESDDDGNDEGGDDEDSDGEEVQDGDDIEEDFDDESEESSDDDYE